MDEHIKNQYCCKECKNKYHREWRAKNKELSRAYTYKYRQTKRDIVDNYKTDKGCSDCGYNEYPYVLSFDHIKGEKSFDISRMMNMSLDKIMTEIEKCEVVCHNCHAIRSYKRNQQGRKYEK